MAAVNTRRVVVTLGTDAQPTEAKPPLAPSTRAHEHNERFEQVDQFDKPHMELPIKVERTDASALNEDSDVVQRVDCVARRGEGLLAVTSVLGVRLTCLKDV